MTPDSAKRHFSSTPNQVVANRAYIAAVVAGAMALLIEQQGRMGNLNEYLYRQAATQTKNGGVATIFHQNIPGYNGVIQSVISPDYDISTGVGTPIVRALVKAKGAALAGTPQSLSNP